MCDFLPTSYTSWEIARLSEAEALALLCPGSAEKHSAGGREEEEEEECVLRPAGAAAMAHTASPEHAELLASGAATGEEGFPSQECAERFLRLLLTQDQHLARPLREKAVEAVEPGAPKAKDATTGQGGGKGGGGAEREGASEGDVGATRTRRRLAWVLKGSESSCGHRIHPFDSLQVCALHSTPLTPRAPACKGPAPSWLARQPPPPLTPARWPEGESCHRGPQRASWLG